MYARGTNKRIKQFQLHDCCCTVIRIEKLIAEFKQIDAALVREITVEEGRAGIHDMANFAYPLVAKAVQQRRENVRRSIEELMQRLEVARNAMAEAEDELRRVESRDERRQMRDQLDRETDWRRP